MGIDHLFISAINVIVLFLFFFMFVVFAHRKNRKIRFKLILLTLLIIGFCLYHMWLHNYLVNLSGFAEKNPGPKSYSVQYLTICHWNSQFHQNRTLKSIPFGF